MTHIVKSVSEKQINTHIVFWESNGWDLPLILKQIHSSLTKKIDKIKQRVWSLAFSYQDLLPLVSNLSYYNDLDVSD